ncbi:MAG: hypothetical protein V7L28_30445 [Nostoc sp.]
MIVVLSDRKQEKLNLVNR